MAWPRASISIVGKGHCATRSASACQSTPEQHQAPSVCLPRSRVRFHRLLLKTTPAILMPDVGAKGHWLAGMSYTNCTLVRFVNVSNLLGLASILQQCIQDNAISSRDVGLHRQRAALSTSVSSCTVAETVAVKNIVENTTTTQTPHFEYALSVKV